MAKKDRLAIFEDHRGYTYYIGWLCWDDEFGDDEGLRLGEGRNSEFADHHAAEEAVKDMKDGREGEDGPSGPMRCLVIDGNHALGYGDVSSGQSIKIYGWYYLNQMKRLM